LFVLTKVSSNKFSHDLKKSATFLKFSQKNGLAGRLAELPKWWLGAWLNPKRVA